MYHKYINRAFIMVFFPTFMKMDFFELFIAQILFIVKLVKAETKFMNFPKNLIIENLRRF